VSPAPHHSRPRLRRVSSDHAHAATTPPEEWQARLRAKGYRLTPQRELVLRAVERLGHATPDEVLAAVREESKAVNISTVYRTLELLEELDLVRHAHITDRAPTYHSTATPPHVHLVCRDCGKVDEVTPDVIAPVTDRLAAEHGFTTDIGHLTIFGTCADCSARSA
jgi:Fur family ferric uptake transcriptional regulator